MKNSNNTVKIMSRCPVCASELTYERGFPGSYWEPPEPEQLFCETCDWEADEPLENYLQYFDESGS